MVGNISLSFLTELVVMERLGCLVRPITGLASLSSLLSHFTDPAWLLTMVTFTTHWLFSLLILELLLLLLLVVMLVVIRFTFYELNRAGVSCSHNH